MLLDHFTLDLIEQLRLRLRLQEVVGSFFFLQDVLFSLFEILRTIESVHPPSTLRLVLFLALLYQLLLKLRLIQGKILVSFPHIVIILLDNVCVDESHLHEGLDAFLEQIPVNQLPISIFGDLMQKTIPQLILEGSEAVVLEELERTHSQRLHVRIFQVVPIQIVEHFPHEMNQDGIVLPLPDEFFQQGIILQLLQSRYDFIIDVLL
mmetsp:Transcript_12723/g.12571  ORF Transcript_12723/g.12571 Transcript_12723/m.12571 type:complete len:207 (-) Transcript_12723:263-883(-)